MEVMIASPSWFDQRRDQLDHVEALLAALVAGPQGHGEPRQDGGETLPLP
jgi:hypothetical protein